MSVLEYYAKYPEKKPIPFYGSKFGTARDRLIGIIKEVKRKAKVQRKEVRLNESLARKRAKAAVVRLAKVNRKRKRGDTSNVDIIVEESSDTHHPRTKTTRLKQMEKVLDKNTTGNTPTKLFKHAGSADSSNYCIPCTPGEDGSNRTRCRAS